MDTDFEKMFQEGDVRRDAWSLLKKIGAGQEITEEDARKLAKYYVETRISVMQRLNNIAMDETNVINALAVQAVNMFDPKDIEDAVEKLRHSYDDVMELYLTLDLLRWLEKIGNVSSPLKVEVTLKEDANGPDIT